MSRDTLEEAERKLEELQRRGAFQAPAGAGDGIHFKKYEDLKNLNRTLIESADRQQQQWKTRLEKAKSEADALRVNLRLSKQALLALRADAEKARQLAQAAIQIMAPSRDAARSFLGRLSAQHADAATLRAAQLLVGQWDQQFEALKELEKALVAMSEKAESSKSVV